MTQSNEAVIAAALSRIQDPNAQRPLADMARVTSITDAGDHLAIQLTMAYPVKAFGKGLATLVEAQLDGSLEKPVKVTFDWQVERQPTNVKVANLAQVKNIIAVASGKGGVGKSTTSVNLALALAQEGAKVGILDADIYGPSQAMMLGVAPGTKPKVVNNQAMVPIEAHGVQSISMAYLVDDNTPMVWRGPMVSGALQQLLLQTQWQDLDYLIVDMPPGTGDIQLTFSQKVPATGAVVVTTPQDIALLDARKGVEMFRKVNIPVLGVIENMAVHVCSNCGHEEHIFGELGGSKIAEEYQTQLLASMPLDLNIRKQADGGEPTVVSDPDGEIAMRYRHAALALAAQVALLNEQTEIPEITLSDD